MARVILLVFRYVPFNPAYGPGHALFRKQGKWIEQWESTGHLSQAYNWERTRKLLEDQITVLFEPHLTVNYGQAMGLTAQAESRVLWFEAICVETFDERPEGWIKPIKSKRR